MRRLITIRRITGGLLLLGSLVGCLVHAGEIPLRNPGFEAVSETGSRPAAWSLSEWTGGPTDISVERVSGGHGGSYAARVNWRSGGNNILLHQSIPFSGEQRCRLSFFFKTDGQTPVSCSVRTLRAGRALQYNSGPEAKPETNWTRYVYEFTTHPQTEQLIVYLRQRGGTVWFDDVKLETIPPPAPLDWRTPEAKAAWNAFAPRTRRRNSLVVQLLDIDLPPQKPGEASPHAFATPRRGWIHIAVTVGGKEGGTVPMPLRFYPGRSRPGSPSHVDGAHNVGGGSIRRPSHAPAISRNVMALGTVRVRLDHDKVYELWHSRREPANRVETMLYVSAGAHTLILRPGPESLVRHLSIRTIPELICCEYESAASGRGKMMAAFPGLLEDYTTTLENFYRHHQKNPMRTETVDPASRARLDAWLARGGRALTHSGIPGLNSGKTIPLEDTFTFWTQAYGMLHLQGIMCDEFGPETPAQLAVYTDAIERMAADKRFAGKTLYAYGPPSWGSGSANRTFRKTLFRHGHKQALEMYLREQPTREKAEENIADVITQWIGSARLDMPGSIPYTVVVLCCCSKNYYGMDCFADVDYRVFLDLQFHRLATDPTCKDLGGVSAWILRYADAEIVDWLGRMQRHYAIDGRTDRLAETLGLTYRLTHLVNPDFVQGLQGWQTAAAGPDGIRTRVVRGFGLARGTMLPPPVGDAVVVLKRNGRKANRLMQTVRNLRPGSLYSLVMYSADAIGVEGGTSTNKNHDLEVRLRGAELLPARRRREVYDRVYAGRERSSLHTWFNRHTWVFRAAAPTAELTITDAPAETTVGIPPPQTLMVNFVEVRRLLAEP